MVATEPLGEADVIGIAVGQYHAADVGDRAAHLGELGQEIAPLAGHAGVDQRELAVLLDEVGVDEVGSNPVQRGRELHRLVSPDRRDVYLGHGESARPFLIPIADVRRESNRLHPERQSPGGASVNGESNVGLGVQRDGA